MIVPLLLSPSQTQDVDTVAAGDVVAMFGVDCSSMDTFTDGRYCLLICGDSWLSSRVAQPNELRDTAFSPHVLPAVADVLLG